MIVRPPSTPASARSPRCIRATDRWCRGSSRSRRAGRARSSPTGGRRLRRRGRGVSPSQAALQSPSAPTSAQRPVVQPRRRARRWRCGRKSRSRSPRRAAGSHEPRGSAPPPPGICWQTNPGAQAAPPEQSARQIGDGRACVRRAGVAAAVDAPSAKAAQTAPAPQNPVAQAVEQIPRENAGPQPEPDLQRQRSPSPHCLSTSHAAPVGQRLHGDQIVANLGQASDGVSPGRSRRRRSFRGAHRCATARARTTKGFRRRRSRGRWSTPASRPARTRPSAAQTRCRPRSATSNDGQPVTEISRVSGAKRSPPASLMPASATGTM